MLLTYNHRLVLSQKSGRVLKNLFVKNERKLNDTKETSMDRERGLEGRNMEKENNYMR